MWDHYKSTFATMQTTICIISVAIYFTLGHRLNVSLVFFAVMHVGSLIGAAWASRLRSKSEAADKELRLKLRV
ncbi:hypothetical protein BH10PLA1_BH10PLA1_04090 [soil metagenome]